MSAVEHWWVSLPLLITEMRSGIRVARGALSVRPSLRLIQLGVKNEKCHERRHQIILQPKREEERRGMSTMHLRVLRGKKSSRVARIEWKKEREGRKSPSFVPGHFSFCRRRHELQSCNNAAETDSRFLSSCNFPFRKDGNSTTDKVEARLRMAGREAIAPRTMPPNGANNRKN